MSEKLTVSMVQTTLTWENKEENLSRFEHLVSTQTKGTTDLYLFPEMFSTGFTMHPDGLEENMEGPTVSWMRRISKMYEVACGGSVIIEDSGKKFNRFIMTEPEGGLHYYDKRHLFSLAGEEKSYTSGHKNFLWEIKGWRIRPLICYDLRFPVWSRNVDSFDILIYVANWPAKRNQAWKKLLSARAIENQCYVVGVNRLGQDPNGNLYSGESVVHDFEGSVLQTANSEEGIFSQVLSLSSLEQFRHDYNFLKDGDNFIMI